MWVSHGRQTLVKVASVVVNCALPLDDRLIEVKVWSYNVYGNGKATVVTVSSPWLPISVVPGTILPPICAITYWLPGVHVGVALAVPVGVAVGVAEGTTVGVGVDVAVAVGVAVGVDVAVAVAVAVGVGVGVPQTLPKISIVFVGAAGA